MVSIKTIKSVPVATASANGQNLTAINQLGGRDIVALRLHLKVSGATAWSSVTDYIDSLVSSIKILGDGEPIISLNSGDHMRIAHFLTKKYIDGNGQQPMIKLDDPNFDITMELLIPIMVKKGQFNDLQFAITYGNWAFSTGTEAIVTQRVYALYGDVAQNWYIRERTISVAAASQENQVTPTLGVPLALFSVSLQAADGLLISAVASNPATRYTNEFDSITFEQSGAKFLDTITEPEMRMLTELVLGVRYPSNSSGQSAITPEDAQSNFFNLVAIDGDALVIANVQNYVYVFDGYGLKPNTETILDVILSSTVSSGDNILFMFLSTEYPVGVVKSVQPTTK